MKISEFVEQLVDQELNEATQKFGPFNSSHEGWAVIREELIELVEDCDNMNGALDTLDILVRNDSYDLMESSTSIIYRNAVHAAMEAIQVAAMAKRYKMDVLKK